jgi:para-nitrobenzyl esterase
MRIRSIAWFIVICFWLVTADVDVASATNDELPLTGASIQRPTTEGRVRGYWHDGTWNFRGIPYARPPVGELRWRAPLAPPSRGATVLDAGVWGPQCPQDEGQGSPFSTVAQKEECLSLNIWSPSVTGMKPVMVWIHGGGFTTGSPVSPLTMGDTLAREYGVVMVTINYRLGALGFLVHKGLIGEDPARPDAAGNYGFLDQIRALEWIRDNIASFGGDPGNVTILGQSAGGISVIGLLASPQSEGLFHKAIVESGPALGDFEMYDLPTASVVGEGFAARLGCADVACMRAKSPAAIVAAQGAGALAFAEAADRTMLPVRDGRVFPASMLDIFRAGRPKPGVPLLVGSNSLEGLMPEVALATLGVNDWPRWAHERFGMVAGDEIEGLYLRGQYPYTWEAATELLTDAFFNCPTRGIVDLAQAGGARVYAYWFDYPTGVLPGALHGAEIAFVFRNGGWIPGSREDRASRSLANYWTTFARNGDPNSASENRWDPWPASYLEVKKRWDSPAQGRSGADYMTWSDAGNWRDDAPGALETKRVLCTVWEAQIDPLCDGGLTGH